MKKMKIDISGFAETRWIESGKISKDSHTVFLLRWTVTQKWSRNTNEEQYCKISHGILAISNRVIMVKLQGKPFNINILQTYVPTQDHDDKDIEQFYEEIQQAITK